MFNDILRHLELEEEYYDANLNTALVSHASPCKLSEKYLKDMGSQMGMKGIVLLKQIKSTM